MTQDVRVHAIILTLNEEMHVARCIDSIADVCASITVIDSGSKDRTVEIATKLGADVIENTWINYATQMNFGIQQVANKGGWILRIDADEVLSFGSDGRGFAQIISQLDQSTDGLLVQRRIHFLGKRIRFGAIEPSWQLRLFRNGHGKCEQRWMDEHITVPGDVKKSKIIVSDINFNSLTWWTDKHNSYASREAIDTLNKEYKFLDLDETLLTNATSQAKIRRFMKTNVYGVIPSSIRAWLYFFYRYIFRLGILDGKEGFIFHSLQGLWYRSLVDAKLREIKSYAAEHDISIVDAIRDRTGIDPLAGGNN